MASKLKLEINMDSVITAALIQGSAVFFATILGEFLKGNSHEKIPYEVLLRQEIVSNIERLKYRINDFECTENIKKSFVEFANEISVVVLKSILDDISVFLKRDKKIKKTGKNEFLDLVSQIIENVNRIKKDSENLDYMKSFIAKKPAERAGNLKEKFERLKNILDML